MASTINASTSAGLVNTADTSGVLQLQTANTTAITVDTSQNVGIGTSSPAVKLDVTGTVVATGLSARVTNTDSTASARAGIQFKTGASTNVWQAFTRNNQLTFGVDSVADYVTIDSSGNLLIGKTSTSNTAIGTAICVDSVAGINTVRSASTNGSTTWEVYSTGASAYRFYVGMGGTISATSTTITGISDQRLKENIRDLDDGLNSVLALKPRKFDWKEGKGANIKNARGFIAQEFETVFPDMIEEWKDPAPEGEEPYKAVNPNLIPTLVKAIQELKAINDTQAETINALTARIVAIESRGTV